MISQEAAQNILGIHDRVHLSPLDMAGQLRVTFFPSKKKSSKSIEEFGKKIEDSLRRLGVKILKYDQVVENVPFSKRLKRFLKYFFNNIIWATRRVLGMPEVGFYLSFKTIQSLTRDKKIQKNVCIICLGEQDEGDLPMTYISNFKTNSIITIVDFPQNITSGSNFEEHFDTAMSLFAYHMTNIVIAVDGDRWMVYNFNASHPIYDLNSEKFDEYILKSIIPKLAAPITPHTFKEFKISKSKFDINGYFYKEIINEMKNGASLLNEARLYPNGKKIDELPFRNNFHKLIGKMHLDNRNGMSFGYIAYQLPIYNTEVNSFDEFKKINPHAFNDSDLFLSVNGKRYLLVSVRGNNIVVKIPDVWVMTLRSGSDKIRFDEKRDLIKLGLINGEMFMEFPHGGIIDNNYKPSFDTKVILAHAVGNAILSSILKYLKGQNFFSEKMEREGIAIAHWHGYINDKKIIPGMIIYGRENPHVSCSSPQAAIYALEGKIMNFVSQIDELLEVGYKGDVHIEPHHGINVSFPSLVGLGRYVLSDSDITELGNKYLYSHV